jgi:hypothetical protein
LVGWSKGITRGGIERFYIEAKTAQLNFSQTLESLDEQKSVGIEAVQAGGGGQGVRACGAAHGDATAGVVPLRLTALILREVLGSGRVI